MINSDHNLFFTLNFITIITPINPITPPHLPMQHLHQPMIRHSIPHMPLIPPPRDILPPLCHFLHLFNHNHLHILAPLNPITNTSVKPIEVLVAGCYKFVTVDGGGLLGLLGLVVGLGGDRWLEVVGDLAVRDLRRGLGFECAGDYVVFETLGEVRVAVDY